MALSPGAKAMRIITSKFDAHSSPIFKYLTIIKLPDLYAPINVKPAGGGGGGGGGQGMGWGFDCLCCPWGRAFN